MKLKNTVIEICLRIFGIWPNSSYVLSRRLFWTISLIIEQILQYQYIVMHFYSINFIEMMNILSATMEYSIFLIKLGIFWYKQRTFNRILAMMAIDWEKCYNRKFNTFEMAYNAKLSQRFANLTMILYTTAVIFYSSNILVKRTNNDKVSNASTLPLILNMNIPFDTNGRFIYELIIIIQFLHLLFCSCAIGLLNALLVNLILHVGGQIDILREWLIKIFPSEGKGGSPGYFTIRKIIKKHQKIIIFSEHIEDLFSNIAMVLFVSDILIICCLGFVLVTSVGMPDATNIIMRTLLFYLVMNMEAFVFCYAGEYLSAKGKSIGDAAYNSLWYESDSKDSRIVLLVIMRSQYQLTITIGKIMNLSLERFTSIIKASASYISVLLAMY